MHVSILYTHLLSYFICMTMHSVTGVGQQDFDLPKDPEEEAYLAKRMLEETERKLFEAAELQYAELLSFKVTLDLTYLLFYLLLLPCFALFIFL